MQMKHLIIFALAGFVFLIGFNMMSGSRHEENRVAVVDSTAPAQATISTDATINSEDIASKPLGEQPKAILDNATTKIDEAQQADKDRLEQMGSAQ